MFEKLYYLYRELRSNYILFLFEIAGVKRKAENAMPTVFDGTTSISQLPANTSMSKVPGRRDSAGPTVNKK